MSRIGLVLEGGGMKGLYTAGVLDVFMENGIMPDVICGTSAGVTFGINLPSKQKGRVIRYNTRFAGYKDYISLHSLLTTGNMVNVPFAYDILPHQLDVFDVEAFKNSGIEFYATITNVNTGEAEYIKLEDTDKQIDVIRASASLPFVSKKVYIDGIPYLDGGIVDNIPIRKCMECGCDKIIVVLTHPAGFVRKDGYSSMAKLFYRKDKNLIRAFERRDSLYNETLDMVNSMEKEDRIFVFRPSQSIKIGRLESDPEVMKQMYGLGTDDANGRLAELSKYLAD